MKILVLNAGSSSLKFNVFDLPNKEAIASWVFERIWLHESFYTIKYNWEKIKKEADLQNHSVAVEYLINDLQELWIVKSLDEIEWVWHRILHGWAEFSAPVLLDEDVVKRIEKYNELWPLHNPANIAWIRAFMQALPWVKNVWVFDTAFHQTMDPEHFLYPVPYEWYEKYWVRRYGFHGTSHRYVYQEICRYLNNDKLKVITCHIGNGWSITAIDTWKVIETSMGFTPLAWIMMWSRSWDIDPSIMEFICNKKWITIWEATNELNKKSGLLWVTWISSDSRDVENAAEEGNEKAILAQNIYAQKIANYIAMYNNMLDGADVIVMTAWVGENSKNTRKMVIERIKSLWVKIDDEKNDFRWEFRLISTDDSSIPVYVIPTNEELMIAQDTYDLIN